MRRLPHKDVAAQALRHIAYPFDQGSSLRREW
jgi:hypothetical protein